MVTATERRPVSHPADRWKSPDRFVPQLRTPVLTFGEPAPAVPTILAAAAALAAPAAPMRAVDTEPRPRRRTLAEWVLAVWRRLEPGTWGLLALLALNLVLLPFAIAKRG